MAAGIAVYTLESAQSIHQNPAYSRAPIVLIIILCVNARMGPDAYLVIICPCVKLLGGLVEAASIDSVHVPFQHVLLLASQDIVSLNDTA